MTIPPITIPCHPDTLRQFAELLHLVRDIFFDASLLIGATKDECELEISVRSSPNIHRPVLTTCISDPVVGLHVRTLRKSADLGERQHSHDVTERDH